MRPTHLISHHLVLSIWICQASIRGTWIYGRSRALSAISEILNQIPTDILVDVLTTGWEGDSDVLIYVESMSHKDYFSVFPDFRESLTLVMRQSGLNTLDSIQCFAGNNLIKIRIRHLPGNVGLLALQPESSGSDWNARTLGRTMTMEGSDDRDDICWCCTYAKRTLPFTHSRVPNLQFANEVLVLDDTFSTNHFGFPFVATIVEDENTGNQLRAWIFFWQDHQYFQLFSLRRPRTSVKWCPRCYHELYSNSNHRIGHLF
jgi:hypothetical protein